MNIANRNNFFFLLLRWERKCSFHCKQFCICNERRIKCENVFVFKFGWKCIKIYLKTDVKTFCVCFRALQRTFQQSYIINFSRGKLIKSIRHKMKTKESVNWKGSWGNCIWHKQRFSMKFFMQSRQKRPSWEHLKISYDRWRQTKFLLFNVFQFPEKRVKNCKYNNDNDERWKEGFLTLPRKMSSHKISQHKMKFQFIRFSCGGAQKRKKEITSHAL